MYFIDGGVRHFDSCDTANLSIYLANFHENLPSYTILILFGLILSVSSEKPFSIIHLINETSQPKTRQFSRTLVIRIASSAVPNATDPTDSDVI